MATSRRLLFLELPQSPVLSFPQSLPRGAFALALAVTLGVCLFAGPASADGVAVFESLTDNSRLESHRTRLKDLLNTDIESSSIVIAGTQWTRLHSRSMPENSARELVARAQQAGYTAWYNGSGDSLASSSSRTAVRYVDEVGARGAPLDSGTSIHTSSGTSSRADTSSYSTQEDLSHLPMAETFPIDGR